MPKQRLNTHPGYLSSVELAEYLGIPFNTVRGWVRLGKLPEPEIRTGQKQVRLWSLKQADEIKGMLK